MWFIQVSGRVSGPFSDEQLKQMRKRGQFSKLYRVSRTGADWQPASTLIETWGPEPGARPKSVSNNAALEPESPPVASPPGYSMPQAEAGSPQPEAEFGRSEWYYIDGAGQSQGPVPDATIVSLGYQGLIGPKTPLARVGSSEWVPAVDVVRFSSVFRRSRGAGGKSVGLVVALCAVLALAAGGYAFRNELHSIWAGADRAGGDGETSSVANGEPESGDDFLITSGDQQDRIVKAVGYVMGTFYSVDPQGQRSRKMQFGSGTAFAITPDGYLLTNEHVAKMGSDEHVKSSMAEIMQSAAADCQAKASGLSGTEREKQLQYVSLFSGLAATYRKDETKVNAALTVFIDQVPFPARIVHVSSRYDMAVLKISRKPATYFALYDGNQPRQGLSVAAIGFPGFVNRGYEKDVAVEEAASRSGEDPERTVPPNHLVYSRTSGEVSRVIQDAVQTWHIEHSAQISSGNSGGPLVDTGGVVVGLNFAGIMDVKTVSKANLALGMAQLRKEIEAHVTADIRWVKGK